MKTFIGVDPGKTGHITIYKDGVEKFHPMPTHKVATDKLLKSGKPKMKSEFHEAGLVNVFEEIRKDLEGCEIYVAIEEVTGRQGWSANNNFNFGYVAGLVKMLCLMLEPKELLMVRPQKWQAVMYSGIEKIKKPSSTGKTMINDTKAMSAKVAQQLAPHVQFAKVSKIDDGKTDSYLICMYAYKKFGC